TTRSRTRRSRGRSGSDDGGARGGAGVGFMWRASGGTIGGDARRIARAGAGRVGGGAVLQRVRGVAGTLPAARGGVRRICVRNRAGERRVAGWVVGGDAGVGGAGSAGGGGESFAKLRAPDGADGGVVGCAGDAGVDHR